MFFIKILFWGKLLVFSELLLIILLRILGWVLI